MLGARVVVEEDVLAGGAEVVAGGAGVDALVAGAVDGGALVSEPASLQAAPTITKTRTAIANRMRLHRRIFTEGKCPSGDGMGLRIGSARGKGARMRAPASYEEGRPSWADLATSDVPAAQSFYTAVFGWDYEPVPGGGYFYAKSAGHVVAGLARGQNPDFPPTWTTYLAVESADHAADRVRAAGGTVIVEPMTVGPPGRMAYFADPQGAAFGVWQGDQHKGAALIYEPNALTWAELCVPDVDGAAAFYNAAFGLGAKVQDFGADAPAYTVFTVGGQGYAGTMGLPYDAAPHHWRVYFGTKDADATAEAVEGAGGLVLAGPTDTAVGRMAAIQDPQGAAFSIVALNEWPEAGSAGA